jgi:hypothetical protein
MFNEKKQQLFFSQFLSLYKKLTIFFIVLFSLTCADIIVMFYKVYNSGNTSNPLLLLSYLFISNETVFALFATSISLFSDIFER